MTDRQIWQQILELMQEAQDRDEVMLNHVKLLHRSLERHEQALNVILALLKLDECQERDGAIERMLELVAQPEHQEESRKIVAQHESHHERRGAFLAQMRKRIEDLQ